MNRETKEVFNIAFQEAHVVDLDFSRWDKFVRLVVVAQLLPSDGTGRFPVLNVDFVGVESIQWESNHLDVELESPEHHCQWTIVEFGLEQKSDGLEILLSGFGGPSPVLRLRCRDISISRIDNATIDRVNPEWNRPYAALARPDFDTILNILKSNPR